MFATELVVSDYPSGELRLMEPSLAHAATSLEWVSDPEVVKYMGADFSQVSIKTEQARIGDLLSNPDVISWAIEVNGRVIGAVEINSIKEATKQHGQKSGKLSLLIGDKSQWGKQIAHYTLKAVLTWAFSSGGFRLLMGRVRSQNQRSWRNVERLGFELQGTETGDDLGDDRQLKIYVMTKSRWQSGGHAHALI